VEEPQEKKSRIKNWVTNITIVLITIILMLICGEVVARLLDGYDLTSFDLQR
jgi:hypothetical protein